MQNVVAISSLLGRTLLCAAFFCVVYLTNQLITTNQYEFTPALTHNNVVFKPLNAIPAVTSRTLAPWKKHSHYWENVLLKSS